MEKIKQKLLDSNLYLDNEYLDKYCHLMMKYDIKPIKFETQQHHILPKHYFIDNNLSIDNSNDNIKTLWYKDHILAHYYLAGCSKDSQEKINNIWAIRYVLNGKNIEDLNIEDIDLNLYQEWYSENRMRSLEASHSVEINRRVAISTAISRSKNKKPSKEIKIKEFKSKKKSKCKK